MAGDYWKLVSCQEAGQSAFVRIYVFEHDLPNGTLLLTVTIFLPGSQASQTVVFIPYETPRERF